MAWQNKGGGGPWGGGSGGSGGGGGGPWGGGPTGGGSNGGGSNGGGGRGGRNPQTPDFDALLAQFRSWFDKRSPQGRGNLPLVGLVGAGLIVAWLATGLYRVQPDEQGIVLTFGKWTNASAPAQPGLNWHWPAPFQTALTPSVTRDNRVEVGFRSIGENSAKVAPDQPEESLMLTGDQNIVAVHFNVFWHVKNAGDYLFGVRHPDGLVKVAAESAMREIIGRTPIQQALTDGRAKIEQDSEVLLQALLDKYGAGIEIRQIQLLAVDPPAPVVDAFNDVQRARLDRDRASNEAEAYSNDIIPRARGDAERLNQEAQAYAQEVINHSEGDAKRFLSVLDAYRANKDVTAERIYLDTMEEVLKNANKIVLDREGGAGSVLPYLPLPGLKPRPDKAPEKAQ